MAVKQIIDKIGKLKYRLLIEDYMIIKRNSCRSPLIDGSWLFKCNEWFSVKLFIQ